MRNRFSDYHVALLGSLVLFLFLSGCIPGNQVKILPSATVTATQADDTDTPEPTLVSTRTPLPTTAPIPTQAKVTLTPVPTLDNNSALKNLVAAFVNLNKAFPYRLTEATSGAATLDRTTDYAAADQVHSSWTQNGKSYETITIGSQTWWKLNGVWDANPSDTRRLVDIYNLIAPNLHNVAYAGQETVMNIPCFIFTYGLTITTSGVNLTGTGKAWIGISDNLPHQLDLNATVNGSPMVTHLVYSFGVKFDIQKPLL